MRTFDPSPLMRASIGFDRMMNLLDASTQFDQGGNGYPPYNIEKLGEDQYRITMAVAGFTEAELDVTVHENRLTISGKTAKDESEAKGRFLHRGIATRAFERRFELADYIQVTAAQVENGLLHVDLVREVPEAKKPRSIEIAAGKASETKVIDQKAA